jgi:hypothetical protein
VLDIRVLGKAYELVFARRPVAASGSGRSSALRSLARCHATSCLSGLFQMTTYTLWGPVKPFENVTLAMIVETFEM